MANSPNEPNHDDEVPDPLPWEFTGGIPEGDHPYVTRHMAESAVGKLTATMHEIVVMLEVHENMTPTTAAYLWQLLNILTGELLAWIRRWPS